MYYFGLSLIILGFLTVGFIGAYVARLVIEYREEKKSRADQEILREWTQRMEQLEKQRGSPKLEGQSSS